MAPKRGESRRTSFAMRADHLALGAVFLCVKIAGAVCSGNAVNDESRKQRTHKYKTKVLDGTNASKRAEPYRAMERKGFRVTADTGCFIPDDHYCTKGGGDTFKGYQRTFFAWFGFMPKQYEKDPPRDDLETDVSPQISHRCHRWFCCRPDHLCFEYKWRNFVRNGCLGPLMVGVKKACGCLLQYMHFNMDAQQGPQCVRAYSPSAQIPPRSLELCTTNEQVKRILEETGFPYQYSFVDHVQRDELAVARAQTKKHKALKAVSPIAKSRKAAGLHTRVREGPPTFDADPSTVFAMDDDEDDDFM